MAPGSFVSATELAKYFATEYVGIYSQMLSYFEMDAMDVNTPKDSLLYPQGLRMV
jgi:hypothetical protein